MHSSVSIFDLQTGQLLNRIDTTKNHSQNNNRSYHDDNNLEVASALDQIRRGFENLTRELGHQEEFDADGMLQNVTVNNRNQNLNHPANSNPNPPSNFTITSIDYVTCPYNINYKTNSKNPQTIQNIKNIDSMRVTDVFPENSGQQSCPEFSLKKIRGSDTAGVVCAVSKTSKHI